MTNIKQEQARAPSNAAGVSWRKVNAGLLGLAGGAAIAGTVFAFSGVYNVGATDGHSAAVESLLRTTMVHSVRKHASSIPVPERLNLRDRVYAAKFFGHYNAACVTCHGAPGVRPDPWVVLYPAAPRLTDQAVVERWKDQELFWIIKNGVKDTGMIALGPTHKDADIWGVTALVRQLPAITPDEYQAMRRRYEESQRAASAATSGASTGNVHERGMQGAGHEH
ncbi:MAG TPA: cytochrome c [Polyangiaceae bacterium]